MSFKHGQNILIIIHTDFFCRHDLHLTSATTMTRSRFIALGEGDALVHPASWAQDDARLHACDGECSSKFRKILHASDLERAELLTALHVGQRRYTRVPSDLTLFFFPLQKSQSIHPKPLHSSHATASSLEQFTRRRHIAYVCPCSASSI